VTVPRDEGSRPGSDLPSTLDPGTLGLAHDAARVFSTVDPKTVPLARDAARDAARVTSIVGPKVMTLASDTARSFKVLEPGAQTAASETRPLSRADIATLNRRLPRQVLRHCG
jgi:hypothetical protein